MSAKYTKLGQLKGKCGVLAREYLTACDFGGNFTYESRSTCLTIVTYFLKYKFPPKSRAVRYSLAGTPNLPFSCPSLVYFADMYGIYKSNEPLLIKKTSFEVKHCKIETVLILRSAQAGKLKKTYI